MIAGLVFGNLVLLFPGLTLFEPLRGGTIIEGWAIVIDSLARLGVILLLFEVGLESTVSEMAKVGTSTFLVALLGVLAPFILGFGVSYLFIKEVPADLLRYLPNDFALVNIHMFMGATLCATSVGMTARVLKDLGKLQTKTAKIVLGAAVIDGVLGLIILAVVSAIVGASTSGTEVGVLSLVRIAATAVGFFVVAIALGVMVVPRMLHLLGHRSVFPSQILAVAKSASLRPDLGKTVEEMKEVTITSRDESVVGLGRKVMRRLRKKPKRQVRLSNRFGNDAAYAAGCCGSGKRF